MMPIFFIFTNKRNNTLVLEPYMVTRYVETFEIIETTFSWDISRISKV